VGIPDLLVESSLVMDPEVLTTKEAITYLRIIKATFPKLVRDGFPAAKVGREWRVLKSELVKLLSSSGEVNMQDHDGYGKSILRQVVGSPCYAARHPFPPEIGGGIDIDAVVEPDIAVEIDSRTPKQVRGAVFDLLCHSKPKKLLILQPPRCNLLCIAQCRHLLEKYCQILGSGPSEVVLLRGHGGDHQDAIDVQLVREALARLGFIR
jgi:excisionase family DNA binding protein